MPPFSREASRSKGKPLFRKLTQSERTSLDLDRPAAEQEGLGIYDINTSSKRPSYDLVGQSGRGGFHHRSTSGTSQFSTATAGSGQVGTAFVHPFQQTPRPYTPPGAASYQPSLRESDPSDSPALTDEESARQQYRSISNPTNNRTPSLTLATSPLFAPPPRPQPRKTSVSRLGPGTSYTSLHSSLPLPSELSSPTDALSSSSLRPSIDKGFRLRSRTEGDPHGPRVESIQEARRRFQEKEKVDDEKRARDEIRVMERRQRKEAKQRERGHRTSSSASSSRFTRSHSDVTVPQLEKTDADAFLGRDYNSASVQDPPQLAAPPARPPPTVTAVAVTNTRKKTQGAWMKLMMWLRTRFIRMGRKKSG